MQDIQEYREERRRADRPLAMAYVKWQQFDRIYDDLEKAYRIGTIFPELNMPFTGRRCVQ